MCKTSFLSLFFFFICLGDELKGALSDLLPVLLCSPSFLSFSFFFLFFYLGDELKGALSDLLPVLILSPSFLFLFFLFSLFFFFILSFCTYHEYTYPI